MSTEKTETGDWLETGLQDPEFQRLYAREDLIEDFLSTVEEEMQRQGVSRSALAARLGCKPSNVTQIFRRTRNLTASTMVDIAFHLGLRLKLRVDRADSDEKSLRKDSPHVWSPAGNVIPLLKHWGRATRTRFTDSSTLPMSADKVALAS